MNIDMKNNNASTLAETPDAIADNLEHMGEQYSEEYKKLYHQSFYVAVFVHFSILSNKKIPDHLQLVLICAMIYKSKFIIVSEENLCFKRNKKFTAKRRAFVL